MLCSGIHLLLLCVFSPFPIPAGHGVSAALWDSESLVVSAGGSVIVVWSCSQMVGKESSPRLGSIAEAV